MTSFRLRVMAQVLPFLLIAPGLVLAQTAPTRGEATSAMKPAAGQQAAAQPGKPSTQFTRAQIDQLLAPIALYPDRLLAQVLMAATYPEQLMEAAQWLQDPSNAALKGDALVQALQPLPWDPSVKSLVPFPQIIPMMTEHMEWTQALGVAFATQQAQVMERVQELRKLAVKSGRLNKMRQVKVQQQGPMIVIEPADPGRIYVPVYNPTVVYGGWPERNYPPVYLPPPRGFVAETIEPGLEFSVGYAVVEPLWVWSAPDWGRRTIVVNTTEYSRITRDVRVAPGNTWQHTGPVVLVAPAAPRPAAVAVVVPPGTVAPPAAAAVVALPQRAASQPNVIQVKPASTAPATTAQPGTPPATTPATPPATTAQPSTTPPGQPPATPPAATAQPTPPKPAQPAATAQPGADKPAQAPAATAQPSPARPAPGTPSAAQTAPKQPDAAQPGTTDRTTERGRDRAQPGQPPAAAAPLGQPAATQADKARPAEPQPGQRQGTAGQPGKDQPKAAEPAVRAPAAGTAPPPAAAAPSQRPERPGPAEVAAPPPTERPAARQQPAPAAAPAPAASPPPAAAQRPAPPPAAQGTSAGTSAPPKPGPAAAQPPQQRPHDPNAARQDGDKGADKDKKDR